jgi:hypothetical protein
MPTAPEIVNAKTPAIFRELAGDRASRLDGSHFPADVQALVTTSLTRQFGAERANEIAFHMLDWNADAAFIVALRLFPERFTQPEIAAGINAFVIHAPNHIPAALKLASEVTNQ